MDWITDKEGRKKRELYNTMRIKIEIKMKEHWKNLRIKVHEAKEDLKKYQSNNSITMSLPKEFEDRFLKIFN